MCRKLGQERTSKAIFPKRGCFFTEIGPKRKRLPAWRRIHDWRLMWSRSVCSPILEKSSLSLKSSTAWCITDMQKAVPILTSAPMHVLWIHSDSASQTQKCGCICCRPSYGPEEWSIINCWSAGSSGHWGALRVILYPNSGWGQEPLCLMVLFCEEHTGCRVSIWKEPQSGNLL